MQPSPSADTRRPSFPSALISIAAPSFRCGAALTTLGLSSNFGREQLFPAGGILLPKEASMAFSPDDIRANREFFAAKLRAEAEKQSVVNWVKKEPGAKEIVLLDARASAALARLPPAARGAGGFPHRHADAAGRGRLAALPAHRLAACAGHAGLLPRRAHRRVRLGRRRSRRRIRPPQADAGHAIGAGAGVAGARRAVARAAHFSAGDLWPGLRGRRRDRLRQPGAPGVGPATGGRP